MDPIQLRFLQGASVWIQGWKARATIAMISSQVRRGSRGFHRFPCTGFLFVLARQCGFLAVGRRTLRDAERGGGMVHGDRGVRSWGLGAGQDVDANAGLLIE
jgi:hypothetical protein